MRHSSICVFAHNEEREIEQCLVCVDTEIEGADADVHILVNGSTDRTAEIAAAFACGRAAFHVHVLALGDKANAWNHFVHDVSGDAEIYVFHDGDCRMMPGALPALHAALVENPGVSAATGFPAVGRSRKAWREGLENDRGVSGNLYALSGRFVRRARDLNFRLPVGLFGEDGFVGSIAKWDFDPSTEGSRDRVLPCPEAEFAFNPLSFFSFSSWRLQYDRLIRYSIRRYQIAMMKEPLLNEGISSLKPHMRDVYRDRLHLCERKWRGPVWTYADWVARRRMRGLAAQD